MTHPSSGPEGARPRGPLIRVATRCATIDDFVDKFAGLASEGALVLPAQGALPIGTEGRFAIRLTDQSVAMRGRCRVTDVRPAPPTPSGGGPRPTLLRVSLLEMEASSVAVHQRLLARRRGVPVPILPEPTDPTEVSPPRTEAPSAPHPSSPHPSPPPVSPLAATMIGVGQRRAGGGTRPLGILRPSALAQPRAPGAPFSLLPNPLAVGVSRAPGASFTLPANPLSEMNAAELASFIDSTLFESDGEDATAEPVPRSAGADQQTDEEAAAVPVPLPVLATEPTERSLPPRPAPAKPMAAAPPEAPTSPTSTSKGGPGTTARRLLPYVACTIAGLAIGYAIRRAPPPLSPRAAAVPPAPAAPPPTIPPPAAPVHAEVAAAPPIPVPTAVPPPPVRPVSQGSSADTEACRAKVVTEPADAKITWRGAPLGRSPVSVTIPCGAGTLTIAHERYAPVTRTMTVEAGTPLAVHERLQRPPATLVITSSPSGAAITVNGHSVGAAPDRVSTLRYEHVTIRASMPGHVPWSKKLYLRAATTHVAARLGGRRR